ncbi:Lactate-responsive regulator LldR in Actinobacteria, GntR family [Rhodococcus wratislaviensis]|uniref:Lactate-responsive regulator LldR in Actinobacteria, GntR family n=1 Tax=Rhodococcus wratislaviensis TaxID=44752 RepID=A0A402CKU9_RHOWR|nr:FCD domain-containing protein [Rhodococcus wratislaviensis]GCE44224.1 Lactate-responsive regulator LldR in Actinobacteria, GntR family [Rhodococcus wratislaviensis]
MTQSSEADSEDPFLPMNTPRVFESVVAEIERAIVMGRLGPGDRLPNERDLASMMQVSRNSVREAMRVLEMFGAVETANGRGRLSGSTIADGAGAGVRTTLRLHTLLNGVPLRDIVEMRVLIESQAAHKAASSATLDDCERLLRMSSDWTTARSAEEANELDTAFHAELARVAGNALAPAMVEGLREAMVRDLLQGFERLADWRTEFARSSAEHVEIVSLIRAGEAEKASEAMRLHCTRLFEVMNQE